MNKVLIIYVNFKLFKYYEFEISYGELVVFIEFILEKVYSKVIEIRKSKFFDFVELGNVGSFFKNLVVLKVVF